MTNSKGAMLILTSIMISSVLTYMLTKASYEKRSVPKPVVPDLSKKEIKLEEKKEESQDTKDDVMKYADKYKQKHAALVREYASEPEPKEKIEVIDFDIYGTNDEYESVEYTLFGDNTLVDEENERVSDPDDSIGRNVIERFNELEHNDIVYVRNHEFNLDIAVVRDPRSYSEFLGGRVNGRS